MSKKVLVLCQRKKGIIHYNDKKVEEEVVPESANSLFILDKIRDDSVFIYKKKRIHGGTKKTRNLKKRARRIKNKSIKNKSIKNKK